MSKPSPARYRTTNWSSYNGALKRRGSLLIWLEKDMTWLAPHDGSPGRPSVFSDAAIQFCRTIKVLLKLPLRKTTGTVASLLKLANLDWAVPYYTTLCRRQKTLAVQIPYRRADGLPNLLVDIEPVCTAGSHETCEGPQVSGRWRMAGPKAWAAAPPSMAQGPSGYGHGHFRHPSGGIHPQQRW